jgi:cytochrome c oxidase cbb3-type subunit 3
MNLRSKAMLSGGLLATGLLVGILQGASPVSAAGQEANRDPMAAENVQHGAKTYAANCSFCHGPTGKGSSNGPSLIDSALVRHDNAGDLIGQVLRNGRMDKGMPAFSSLEAGQVSDVVAFLHARITATDSRETAGPKSGYQMKGLLTGDATAGKAYFNGAGGCNKCHSGSGDLAGVATKYQPTALEGRILYPRGKASTARVTLSDGSVVQGTVAHIDPFYVAVIDLDGLYHSWERTKVKVDIDDPLSGHLALLGKYTNKDVHDLFAYLETLK